MYHTTFINISPLFFPQISKTAEAAGLSPPLRSSQTDSASPATERSMSSSLLNTKFPATAVTSPAKVVVSPTSGPSLRTTEP
jgi:hypothetical protein